MSLAARVVSTGFPGAARRSTALIAAVALALVVDVRNLYAQQPPLAASVARAAREAGQHATRDGAAAADRHGASLAEKTAWAYLLVGGCIFIATSPGEKNADGSWSRDGKAEMVAGIGAVGISFALLRDILRR